MPLNAKGEKILAAMEKTYGDPKVAKSVLYASENKGNITGIHDAQVVGEFTIAGPPAVTLADIQRHADELWQSQTGNETPDPP